ncbi:MAG: glycosyltransferase [Alphaproteobacteria bacterium]|nr:glycosyltransferase [Alphaproteobacteria bacterium]
MDRNVICIKWGTKFGSEYVNRLYKMVEKNLSLPHRFVCFTDNADGLNPGVEVRELPPYEDNTAIGDKGWRKLSLFNSELSDLKGTALFLDLDIVIRESLNPFFEAEGDFLIVKDWDFPEDIIGNSSVFRFEVGKHPDVLEDFYKLGNDIRKEYKNEQAYLSYAMHKKGILKYWDRSWCVSFKRNCLQPFPLNFFKMPKDPVDAKIIVFHGRPTPEQAKEGFWGKGGLRYVKPTKWLDKYWNV